jgi:spermidine synthase
VIPWRLLDTATVPGGEGSLRLLQRGGEFSIRLDHYELMNSRISGSEEVLASIACDRIKSRKAPSVLIGGLGMGFTLRAALASLGPDAGVTVAELVPAVVKWASGPMIDVFGSSLADPRLRICEADVGELIRSSPSKFDAILLDVDNGPDGLTRKANDALYDLAGLRASRRALRTGGILAIWSAKPDPNFTLRLRKTGFNVDMLKVPAGRSRSGKKHVIWIATCDDAIRAQNEKDRAARGP